MRRLRLDAELVRRGLARSREHAAELVDSGRVRVGGRVAVKPATAVDPAAAVVVDESADGGGTWVSRGAQKLLGALAAFEAAGAPVAVTGRRCLDAGASTGGFTEVLLSRGAAGVVAVDVGYGQLAWSLRTDERVQVLERQNVRTLEPEQVGGPVDLVTADLSFISLGLVLPALARCTAPEGELLLMVKPQFEVGRGRVGAGGVVRDPSLRAEAVRGVAEAAGDLGLGVAGVAPSGLPGPRGNREVFLRLRRGAPPLDGADLAAAVSDPVEAR